MAVMTVLRGSAAEGVALLPDLRSLSGGAVVMNAPDYLGRLREKTQVKTHMEGTAKTAKTNLRSLCSSPIEQKNLISSTMTSYRWLIQFADRNPLQVAFSPEASHAEALDAYPDALAAEPLEGESWT